ncbi:MAG: ATP-dependent DNA helicase RecG, partial [Saprospiraceae bacterium]|nr:ATP-dependent DNA helicase RecG [Saprospiraceae bacterium]
MLLASSKLQNQISYLKGVGPQRGELLTNELSIQILEDLLLHFPYRYIDKTQFHKINEINEEDDFVQVKGILRRFEYVGDGRKKRLVARLRDETGSIELVWFQQLHWVEKNLKIETPYIVYGRLNNFKGQFNIPHPEIEEINDQNQQAASAFEPVYSTTEKLSAKGLDAKGIRKLTKTLIESITNTDIDETLPDYLLQKFKFPKILQAFQDIHFPKTASTLESARNRLKFEELFYLQLRLLRLRKQRNVTTKGHNFTIIGDYFNTFFNEKLPFELTTAQKRVIKEIRKDVGSGKQMNRLLQGDVGSGKTVVALMTMLMALDNSQDGIPYQACLMAPTEILAQQHFIGISEMLKEMHINVAFLSGSIKGKKRERILELLQSGEIHILIGTHALIEDWVVYKNLGIVIIDEQHRFGVAQRAALWKKGLHLPPHVLVMTATPIPRTLAMTLYGDLDVSVIDELPPGRKEIKTLHKTEQHRLRVIGFMKEEIAKGQQIYVVFPLIEESETLDLLALQQGYEALLQEFPLPEYK